MLWEVDIYPADGQPDVAASNISSEARELSLVDDLRVWTARGYLIEGNLDRSDIQRLARELLVDPVVERSVLGEVGETSLTEPPEGAGVLVHVLPKPGVMDPVAQSAVAAIGDFDLKAQTVRTLRKYWFGDLPADRLRALCTKVLANEAIDEVIVGPLDFDQLQIGSPYRFEPLSVAIRELDATALAKMSREQQLYLQTAEMEVIRDYYRGLDRDPTDAELETIAQTWSEHCSHKTLAGRIHYIGPEGERQFENMLRETIFAATQEIRKAAGDDDWCVSVFEDNAGIVRFDEENNVVFKVETHNHPSALEPYGGANTGIGGVIRDPLGTGMGAKPICNTDVFCFAPPDTPSEDLPRGVLHPKRVMRGVVSGVRDYGNRIGIPTVNGALFFDPRYLGNPLVYCGNVGILPRDQSSKETQPGDSIVVVGGRTGRDGIHGATFSSAELTHESESLSGGAVQIGNAITEKMVVDVILAARDLGLYNAITDCGAGGLSSAVGEMGEHIGAEVWLEKAPLKYDGLTYTEIWISEAQERMVLAVPPEKCEAFHNLCAAEGVEATVIGRFEASGRLCLKYQDNVVADLDMRFLHDGRPPVIREARYTPPAIVPLVIGDDVASDHGETLLRILGSLNVCSKEWVIRQYDHEVQGGSVIKPLVGALNDGPSDAAVVRPVLSSRRGIVVACGMNPRYGDFDTYHMTTSAIDEAIRNCVAVGADPQRIAILDNFCWGDCERAETLGSLVRAAIACYELACELGTPFISGKDSLNNEFSYVDDDGESHTIAIPPTLLISAMGQMEDTRRAVTMDLKRPGNVLYQLGVTRDELGGSHFAMVTSRDGGQVPRVDSARAKQTFAALHQAISQGLVRACHDMSEGGLAVTVAEMAFAGCHGAQVDLDCVPHDLDQGQQASAAHRTSVLLFSESNTRFVCEVAPECVADFEREMADLPCARIGEVVEEPRLRIVDAAATATEPDVVIETALGDLKEAWQAPLRW